MQQDLEEITAFVKMEGFTSICISRYEGSSVRDIGIWFPRFGRYVRTGHHDAILCYISRPVPLALSFFLSLFPSSALYLSSGPILI